MSDHVSIVIKNQSKMDDLIRCVDPSESFGLDSADICRFALDFYYMVVTRLVNAGGGRLLLETKDGKKVEIELPELRL